MDKQVLLGAHMSIAGGYYKAIERGHSIGCTTIQIFTQSNRQWATKKVNQEEAMLFKETASKLKIKPIISHASYLINLASSREETRAQSIHALIEEMKRCTQLGIPFVVLHPGSNNAIKKEEGLDLIVSGINRVLQSSSHLHAPMILLETMAGQGGALCSKFEDIAYILNNVPQKLGVCVDTCHIFAAGYDIKTEDSYKKTWKQFDAIVGLENLKAIHLNDSKKECGSRVDRHEHIGKGKLGDTAFSLIMNDKNFAHIPKILETPKGDDLSNDLHNIHHLINLLV